MKKYALILIIALIIAACGGGKKDGAKADGGFVDGQKIFKQSCMLCHGENGKLGLNGAKDLTQSKLSLQERVELIKNGKNAMTGFSTLLSENEIKAVAAYTYKLK